MKPKPILSAIHRYIGLIFAPILLIVVITGAILAFKPIFAPELSDAMNPTIHSQQLLTTLNKIDPEQQLTNLAFMNNGTQLLINNGQSQQIYDLKNSQYQGKINSYQSLFQTAKSIHKSLLINANFLVEFATYAMLLILLIAPCLMWPKFKKNLLQQHNLWGWLGYPLWLAIPITAIMMLFHIGAPDFKNLNTKTLPVSQIVQIIDQSQVEGQLSSIENIKNKYQIIYLKQNNAITPYQIDNKQLIEKQLGFYWAKQLHEGTWLGKTSAWINALLSLGLLALLITGCYSWLRRKLPKKIQINQEANILITYASQTGTAEKLARHTAQFLQENQNPSMICTLNQACTLDLNAYSLVLIFISTTGTGNYPDQAQKFVQQLNHINLTQPYFALIALGDSTYPDFCAAGKNLYQRLTEQQVQEFLPPVFIDGDPNLPWQKWLQNLATHLGIQSVTKIQNIHSDEPCTLTLVEKNRLDQSSNHDKQTWQLRFITDNKNFRPGDLLLIKPTEQTYARSYSIGSSSIIDNEITLTVGLEYFYDESGIKQVGLCSGFLCQTLPLDETIQATIRPHESFHPPIQPEQKIILIAAGTGIAPYLGFIQERTAQLSLANTWLFFGNRSHKYDYLYESTWKDALDAGILYKIDTAFSRDEPKQYIQDILMKNSHEIFDWIHKEHAHIYICGKESTIGKSALDALKTIYQNNTESSLIEAEQWLEDLQNNQIIHLDLFN